MKLLARFCIRFALSVAFLVSPAPFMLAESPAIPNRPADAVVDLTTTMGVNTVSGQWRYSDTRIVQADFRAPDSNGQPTGAPIKTYDYEPHAGGATFDDSSWPVITAESLKERRSTGRLCFNWYRINVTVPSHIGSFATDGSTAVFETSLDDYAEVWVNGELPRYLGQTGGSVISGWNAPNRVVIGRNLVPGQKIQLAVFGINGPISNPPTNFIWVRLAKLSFYTSESSEPYAVTPSEVNVEVVRKDSAIDAIVPPNTKIFKLAEGFKFTEGPVWIRDGNYLLFSDPNNNRIYKYTSDGNLSIYREKSGYSGADIDEYNQPGSNGLTVDPQGRLTINQHGNRRVIRADRAGDTVLADRYNGKRLNSPNDLVYRSDGTLFFTDPPFGLPKFDKDPRKELPFSGVYSLHNGKLQLVSTDMTGPNGIAFSPDEKFLYVGNWDDHKKVIYRYEVKPDGTLQNGIIFFDMTDAPGEDAIDGIKVDSEGDLFVSGPGGLWVISPKGIHLGTIIAPMHPHNMAWGDEDHQSLYLTAKTGLYKIRLNVKGAGIPR
jgi:gluconolactonase